jgi:pyruvate formate lyase activating enzyme
MKACSLKIHSIDTFGTHDGPGIRLVIFTQGCPFHCLYCHNPDTQDLETDKMKVIRTPEILELLEKEKTYFGKTGGLTISGGEPTLQVDALIELFQECKKHGFHTCLDTCGAIFNSSINQLYDLTDIVLLDVKHINPVWHQKITGQSNENPLQNAVYREKTGKEMWLRYVLVPTWTDQEEHLEAWAKYFADYRSVTRVEIIPYHKLGVFKYEALGRKYELDGVEPPNKTEIAKAEQIFIKYLGKKVIVV